jgi:hypothetical protein
VVRLGMPDDLISCRPYLLSLTEAGLIKRLFMRQAMGAPLF